MSVPKSHCPLSQEGGRRGLHTYGACQHGEVFWFQLADWELDLLSEPLSFDDCQIDPSPFQLVERTSLFKAHSIFSLLSLHHAYVTNTGRLVGMVGVKEVSRVVELNCGCFFVRTSLGKIFLVWLTTRRLTGVLS